MREPAQSDAGQMQDGFRTLAVAAGVRTGQGGGCWNSALSTLCN